MLVYIEKKMILFVRNKDVLQRNGYFDKTVFFNLRMMCVCVCSYTIAISFIIIVIILRS